MSGANRGCGFAQGDQISWVCLVERGQESQTLNRQLVTLSLCCWTHSEQSSCTLSLCPAFLQRFDTRHRGREQLPESREDKNTRRLKEKFHLAAMKDKIRRGGGGRNPAKTGEEIPVKCWCLSLSALSSSFFSHVVPPSLENVRRMGYLALLCCSEQGLCY